MKRSRCRRPVAPSPGFTLIELVVVLAIVAIMAAVAMPSMRSMIESNRTATEANAFAGDLQFARSEAIKQGLPVSLCPSSNGTSCSGSNNWSTGWIVFPDPDSLGEPPDDGLLRVRPAWKSSDTFSASPSTTLLTFSRDGFASVPVGSGTAVVLTLKTTTANASATRCVSLNRVGHQTVQKGGEEGCS